MQRGAAHHLHVEVPLVQHPPGGFARDREGLGQQLVEAFPGGVALLELVGLAAQLGVGQLLDVMGQGADVVGHTFEALDHAAFTKAQHSRQHSYTSSAR